VDSLSTLPAATFAAIAVTRNVNNKANRLIKKKGSCDDVSVAASFFIRKIWKEAICKNICAAAQGGVECANTRRSEFSLCHTLSKRSGGNMAPSPTRRQSSFSVLQLCDVLEEEYLVLHGSLPEDYKKRKQEMLRTVNPDSDKESRASEINRQLVPIIYSCIHNLTKNNKAGRSALCLSGGGIRSGTFALGVLQGLARCNLLEKFDYLSTVSGGGYIGGWLTAWIHRHPKRLEGVSRELAESAAKAEEKNPLQPEPEPIRFLRSYSNFLTPRAGALTVDTWTFIVIVLRNLLINWTVLIPLLLVAVGLPRLGVAALHLEQPGWWTTNAALVTGFAALVMSLVYVHFNRPSIKDSAEITEKNAKNRPDETNQAKTSSGSNERNTFVSLCLFPLMVAGIALTVYWAWFSKFEFDAETKITLTKITFLPLGNMTVPLWAGFVGFGAACAFTAWAIYALVHKIIPLLRSWRESLTPPINSLRHLGRLVWNALLTLVTGAFSGWIAYLLATRIVSFHKPTNEASGIISSLAIWSTELYLCFAFPLFLMLVVLAIIFIIAITSRGKVIKDEDHEWWSRFMAYLTLIALAWSAFSLLVLFGPWLLSQSFEAVASLGIISGLLTLILGRSSKTPASSEQQHTKMDWKSALAQYGLKLAAPVFLVFFIIALSYAMNWLVKASNWLVKASASAASPIVSWWARRFPYSFIEWMVAELEGFRPPLDFPTLLDTDNPHLYIISNTPLWLIFVLLAALLLIGLLIARFVLNLNRFSLHAAYRNRLVRAFLGASRPAGERKANAFTGFDPADNLDMSALRPGLLNIDHLADTEGAKKSFIRKIKSGRVSEEGIEENNRTNVVPDQEQRFYNRLYKELSRVSEKDMPELKRALELLDEQDEDEEPTKRLLLDLISGINRVLTTSRLYTEFPLENPAMVAPSDELSQSEILYNRLSLQQFFSDEIAPYKFPPPPHALLHIVNLTLNLVKGKNLAWQQRKAASFTISPLHAGSYQLGYRRSVEYGGFHGGISLGTAATISGAAANPNMGYYSASALVTFFMTFFNVRLGWWLGNPGRAGDKIISRWKGERRVYQYPYPKWSIWPLIAEALGRTDAESRYVNLSDGGHFENLGLYEMVLRRCHFIVVVDGAQDEAGEFDDLGNAVRKIRVDLGIPIRFQSFKIFPRSRKTKKGEGKYVAVGEIDYKAIDGEEAEQGVLIYIKPAIYGDEPRDVLNYAERNREFPHQTAVDQFFDESQFESYRRLGLHAVEEIFKDETGAPLMKGGCDMTLDDLQRQVEVYLKRQ
jgi:hypothetical protein